MSDDNYSKYYWREYYKSAEIPEIPSQFAVFTLGELSGTDIFIDVGCGTGRDSFFFARQGYPTIGVDRSETAISRCLETRDTNKLGHLHFECASVNSPSFSQKIENSLKKMKAGNVVTIYARFFMHAITENEERMFLQSIQKLPDIYNIRLAFEFRTIRDKLQKKLTPDHYRRFIEPHTFFARASSAGFEPVYFIEGFGFAKFKDDDAHVARFIFNRK